MLSDSQIKATLDVARGKLSGDEIARKYKVSARTIDNWKSDSEFAAEVEAHLTRWYKHVATSGIADQRRRVFRLNQRWRQLQGIIDARREFFPKEQERIRKQRKIIEEMREALPPKDSDGYWDAVRLIPEDEADIPAEALTGLQTRKMRTIKVAHQVFRVVWEYEEDTGLLSEMRALEQQAAVETGQWKQRIIMQDESDATVEALADLLTPEELADLARRHDERTRSQTPEPGAADPGCGSPQAGGE